MKNKKILIGTGAIFVGVAGVVGVIAIKSLLKISSEEDTWAKLTRHSRLKSF